MLTLNMHVWLLDYDIQAINFLALDIAVSSTRYDNRQNYNGRVFVYSIGTATTGPANELQQNIAGTQVL